MKYGEALKIMGPEDVEGAFRVKFILESKEGLSVDLFPDIDEEVPLIALHEAWDAARRFASAVPWARNVTVVNDKTLEPVDPHRVYNYLDLNTISSGL